MQVNPKNASQDVIVRNTRYRQRLEKTEQHVIFIDDVTWHEVRRAREQELKYLRDLGVYEEVDEREAIAHYQVTPVDTKWIDTNKAFEEEPMQDPTTNRRKRIHMRRQARCVCGDFPLEALKAFVSIAANHKQTYFIMHIDVSRAYFHAKAQRPVLVRLQVEDERESTL